MRYFPLSMITALTFAIIFSTAVSARGDSARAKPATAPSAATARKVLVAYFSHTGNTREIAAQIRRLAGADIFEITSAVPYTTNHDELTKFAKTELAKDTRPKLRIPKIPNLESYDVVFIGYPVWWYTTPRIIVSFLSENNFSGKTVVPFTTHGGSGLAGVDEIRKLAAGAVILDGLAMSRNNIKDASQSIAAWLRKLGLLSYNAAASA